MAFGPGKYDQLADHCITEANAEAVVVIVFGGDKGGGMSVKIRHDADFEIAIRNIAVLDKLPGVLRHGADSIERDANRQA